MDAKQLKQKRSQMASDRSEVQAQRVQIAEYAEPYRKFNFEGAQYLTPPDSVALSDPTLEKSLRTNADGTMELLFPRGDEWIKLDPPESMKNNNAVKDALRNVALTVSRAIRNSNFYEKSPACLFDRATYGDCTLWIDYNPVEKQLAFFQIPCGTYYAELDRYGRTMHFCFDEWMTPETIMRTFPAKNIPERISNRSKTNETYGNKDLVFTFVEYDRKSRKWLVTTIHDATEATLRQEKYNYDPVVYARFNDVPYSSYGSGRGIVALGDAKQIVETKSLQIQIFNQEAFPPMLIGQQFQGKIDYDAGGVTVFNEYRGNGKPERLFPPSNRLMQTDKQIEDNKANIQSICDLDLFDPIAGNIKRPEDMKATVANYLASYRARAVSPVYMRMIGEFMIPVIKRTIGILLRRKEIELPVDDYSLRVVTPFQVFLDQQNVQNMEVAFNALAPVVSFAPEILDNIDNDKMAVDIFETLALGKYVRGTYKVKQIREQRAAAQQQAASLEAQLQQSEATLNNANATKAAITAGQ